MEPAEAAVRVLTDDAGSALHWTVIWDRALQAGFIDPREHPDARSALMRALADHVRTGRIEKTSTGTYRVSEQEQTP